MKKIFVVFFSMFVILGAYGQDIWAQADGKTKKTLTACDKLVNNKKYLSAYNLLQAAPQNDYILAKKTHIILNYFAKSMMHQMFALVDLDAKQDLQVIRTGDGKFDFFVFDPSVLFSEYEKENGESGILQLYLGTYYFNVISIYRGKWVESDSDIMNKAVGAYKKAYDKNYLNAETLTQSYYFASDEFVGLKKYAEAIKNIESAEKINSTDSKVPYEKCWVYIQWGKMDNAENEAIKFITMKEKSLDETFNNIKNILGLYIEQNKEVAFKKVLEKIVNEYKPGPFGKNTFILKSVGNMYMFLYNFDLQRLNDKAAARADLDGAERAFKAALSSGQVFIDIENLRSQL